MSNVTYCGHSINASMLICRDYDGMLLSWAVCRALRIVLQDYPQPIMPVEPGSAKVIHAEYSLGKGSVANPSPDICVLGEIPTFLHLWTAHISIWRVQWLDPLLRYTYNRMHTHFAIMQPESSRSHGSMTSKLSWTQLYSKASLNRMETHPALSATRWWSCQSREGDFASVLTSLNSIDMPGEPTTL